MKIRRILSLILVCSMLFCVPVMAEENNVDSYDAEVASLEYLESISLEKREPIALNSGQINELFAEEGIRAHTDTPDAYESNDTITTAFPYNQVSVVTSEMTSKYDLYSLGMRHSGLHSENDEDWFSINLSAGEDYFVDLRNIGQSNWYIELYYIKSDNTGYFYTTNPEEMPVFEKWPEKYFYFTAKDTGTYYIRISSGNDWSNEMDYFFYVGPAIQYFNIVDMPTYGMVQLFGSDYATYTLDLSDDAVPEVTAIVNLTVIDNFPQGKVCGEVQRCMRAGGKTYYSTSGGNSGVINNISGVSLGQVWTIGAKCTKGTHVTYWTGKLKGRFGCVMAPYPGFEVSF